MIETIASIDKIDWVKKSALFEGLSNNTFCIEIWCVVWSVAKFTIY